MIRFFIALFIVFASSFTLAAGDYRQNLVDGVNAARAKNGLKPVEINDALNGIAPNWAAQLAAEGELEHRSRFFLVEQLEKRKWKRMNENLHASPEAGDPAVVVRSWLKSEVHRKNLMDADMRLAGVGFARGRDGKMYVVWNGAVP